MPLVDDVWQQVPVERRLDEDAVRFALDTARMGQAGAKRESVRLLDLGCGDGKLTAMLAATGAAVTGVDPSPVALERAREAHPELEFVAPASDGRLPLGDNRFDVVVCVNVLQHVPDTQSLMSEVRRVLAPGGLFAVAVPWHGRLRNVVIALASFERHHDPLEPVVRFYTRRSLDRLLSDFGFERPRLSAGGGAPLARRTLFARARRGAP